MLTPMLYAPAGMAPADFRRQAIRLTVKLGPENLGISRHLQFLSVAIFDKFLVNSTQNEQQNHFSYFLLVPTLISCSRIASKF